MVDIEIKKEIIEISRKGDSFTRHIVQEGGRCSKGKIIGFLYVRRSYRGDIVEQKTNSKDGLDFAGLTLGFI